MTDLPKNIHNDWFNELPEDVVAELTPLAKIRHLKKGEYLFKVNSPPDGLYGVMSGRIRSSAISETGKELVIALFEPGNWFGEISMFDGLGRTHDARAILDSDIFIVPRHAFLELLEKKPSLNIYFYKMLCRKLRLTLARVEDDYFQPISTRLAKRLSTLARAYGVETDDGTLIDLHLPQETLSQMVGAARPVINRELNELKQKKIIHIEYGRLTLLDAEGLESLCVEDYRPYDDNQYHDQ